ncbi:MAG: HD domain-containing protein [Candidatus Omnitrophica bacterium]|nr:HD domain-containing protein [Candidatus Omnitrophota bacterium]
MKINPTKTINQIVPLISYVADLQSNRGIYHGWRTAIFAARLAEICNPVEIKSIFYAALLLDIGGIGLAYHITHYLIRNDRVSQDALLSHPIIGAQIVSNIPGLSNCAKIILDHHEWCNGRGYPRAKNSNDITPGAQVTRISDTLDIALRRRRCLGLAGLKSKLSKTVNREYSEKLLQQAFEILRGGNFFKKMIDRGSIPTLFKEAHAAVGSIRIPARIDAIGGALRVIAEITDMKHPYTYGHSLRVSRYAMSIALAMKLEHDQVTKIKWAGLIHDIGKISVSRKILDKPNKLTGSEYRKVQEHVKISGIMKLAPSLQEIAPIAAGHHEYFDGSGYPMGTAGMDIPLGARIITICDAYDAMTSNRPYRGGICPKEVCQKIQKLAGSQFDPEIVKFALPVFRSLEL